MSKKLYQKIQLVFLILLFTQFSYGQLSNFTFTVTHTEETCTANGTVTFSVSNTTPGATMVYAIYAVSDLANPIIVVNGPTYNGLTAGNYVVIATQSLGVNSGTQQQQFIIANQITALTYIVSSTPEVCGNDAVITVSPITGTAATYEIFAGPMTRAPQASNVFTGMADGQYTIRVIDGCGEGVVQTYTVISKNPALVFTNPTAGLAGCNSVSLAFGFSTLVPSPNGIVKFPLQVVLTVTPPSGSPIITNSTIASGNDFSIITPLFTPQPYNYSFVITDGCGVHYTISGVVSGITNSVSTTLINVTCNTKKIKFTPITSLIMTGAPAGYPNPLPQDFTSQISDNQYTTQPLGLGVYTFQAVNVCGQAETLTVEILAETPSVPYSFAYAVGCNSGSLAFLNVSQIILVSAPPAYTGALPYDFTTTINSAGTAVLTNLPPGTYTCSVLDRCGNPSTLTGVIAPASPAPGSSILPTCENNNTNTLNISGELTAITLTGAPAAYTGTVPQNYTSQVIANNLNFGNLPLGTYTFSVTNSCAVTNTLTVVIPTQTETTVVNAIQNCGSFNLDLHHTSNSTATSTFWLQKYYAADNDWGHPATGVLQGIGLPGITNGIQLTNNFLTLNLPYSGQFRVVKVQPIYVPGINTPQFCFKVINEFQTNGQPEITGVNSIACNNTFDVIVDATGFGPLTYKITTKNGAPFIINNGTSNLFTNLAPAIYNFQVVDFCGNIVNRIFEINVQNPLQITPSTFCLNQPASLSVSNYGFLTYQWWKSSNPSVILSTSNVLNIPNFTLAAAGTYVVKITYPANPASCLNTQLSYVISADGFTPNAGNGSTVAYCEGKPAFDLFTLIDGAYDAGGTWEVVTNNTTITGSNWDSTTAVVGLYKFKYRVTGNCNAADEAIINVTIKEIPDTPVASVDPLICDSKNINLFATAIPGANYQWTGPDSFTSSAQNPVIADASTVNNGSYTVKAVKAGCESEVASVAVVVNASPQFTLEGGCSGGRFKVTAIPVNNSYDAATVSYSWTGPNNYTNSANPIDITQLPVGDYALTITSPNGCDGVQSLPVTYTFCEIPNVITPNQDGANDSFDLSGLDVEKLEIYSRWGRKVFEKDNYTNEWYGQNMHGDYLPDSTYYYYIRLRNQEAKVGWIFVTRG